MIFPTNTSLNARHNTAFGLVQALVTVVLIGIVASIAVPAARDALTAQRGRASTENLRIIEEAKRAFVLNNPGVALTSEDQLMPYFPSHAMPVGAHKGESYLNTTSLSAVATSSVNAASTFEPWSSFFGEPSKNGFNDLGNADPVLPTAVVSMNDLPPGDLVPDPDPDPEDTTVVPPTDATVTINSGGNGAGLIVNNGATTGTFPTGTTITLSATPDLGYGFSGWSGDAVSSSADYSFPLAGSVVLTANFLPINYTLTIDSSHPDAGTLTGASTYLYGENAAISAVAKSGWAFLGWSGDITSVDPATTVLMDGDKTVTAMFSAQFELTTNVAPFGSGTVLPASGTFNAGDVASLIATPNTGYSFTGWSGAVTSPQDRYSLTMNADASVTANFLVNTYQLTATVFPTGAGSVSGAGPYQYAETASVVATPSAGWVFGNWTGDLTGTETAKTLLIDQSKAITANMSPTVVVSAAPAGAAASLSGGGTYAYNSAVNLEVVPNTGFEFTGWSGDVTGSDPSMAFTVVSPVTAVANFQQVHHDINVTVSPAPGGSVTGIPNVAGAGTAYHGDTVSLTATPASGYTFSGWTGGFVGQSSTYAFTANNDVSLTANFTVSAPNRTLYVEAYDTLYYNDLTVPFTRNGAPSSSYVSVPDGVGQALSFPETFDVYTLSYWYYYGSIYDAEGNWVSDDYASGSSPNFTVPMAGGNYDVYLYYDVDMSDFYRDLTATVYSRLSSPLGAYTEDTGTSIYGIGQVQKDTNGYLYVQPAYGATPTTIDYVWFTDSDGNPIDSLNSQFAANPLTFSNYRYLLMDQNVHADIYLTRDPASFSLAYTVTPANAATLTVTPEPNFTGGRYVEGTEITLSSVPTGREWAFTDIRTGSTWNPTIVSTIPDYTFSLTQNTTIRATYAAVRYNITTSAVPAGSGSIGAIPAGLTNLPPGTAKMVTATPYTVWLGGVQRTYAFTDWTLTDATGIPQTLTDNPLPLNVESNINLVANFTLTPLPEYTITIRPENPLYGDVSFTAGGPPTPTNGTATTTVTAGTSITIHPIPATGYAFDSWRYDNAAADGFSWDVDRTWGADRNYALMARFRGIEDFSISQLSLYGAPHVGSMPTATADSTTSYISATLNYSVTGAAPAPTNVKVTFTLPAGVEFLSMRARFINGAPVDVGDVVVSGNTVTWDLSGHSGPWGYGRFEFNVKPTTVGLKTVSVQLTADDGNYDKSNDYDSTNFNVIAASPMNLTGIILPADGLPSNQIQVGATRTMSVVVSRATVAPWNITTQDTFENVNATLVLPDGVTYVSSSSASGSTSYAPLTRTVTATFGDFAPEMLGGLWTPDLTFEVSYTVDQAGATTLSGVVSTDELETTLDDNAYSYTSVTKESGQVDLMADLSGGFAGNRSNLHGYGYVGGKYKLLAGIVNVGSDRAPSPVGVLTVAPGLTIDSVDMGTDAYSQGAFTQGFTHTISGNTVTFTGLSTGLGGAVGGDPSEIHDPNLPPNTTTAPNLNGVSFTVNCTVTGAGEQESVFTVSTTADEDNLDNNTAKVSMFAYPGEQNIRLKKRYQYYTSAGWGGWYDASSAPIGAMGRFIIDVELHSFNSQMQNVVITDEIPAGWVIDPAWGINTWIPGSTYTISGNTFTVNFGNITFGLGAPGTGDTLAGTGFATGWISIPVKPVSVGTYTNTAVVTSTTPFTQIEPDKGTVEVTITSNEQWLIVSGPNKVRRGEIATYRAEVVAGQDQHPSGTVAITIPAGWTFSGMGYTSPAGTIASGGTTATFTFPPASYTQGFFDFRLLPGPTAQFGPTDVHLEYVPDAADANLGDNTGTVVTDVIGSDVAVTVEATQSRIPWDANGDFRVRVHNGGAETLTNVQVTTALSGDGSATIIDSFSPAASFTQVSPGVLNMPSVPANSYHYFTYRVKANSGVIGTSGAITLSATANTGAIPDPTPDNNTASSTIQVGGGAVQMFGLRSYRMIGSVDPFGYNVLNNRYLTEVARYESSGWRHNKYQGAHVRFSCQWLNNPGIWAFVATFPYYGWTQWEKAEQGDSIWHVRSDYSSTITVNPLTGALESTWGTSNDNVGNSSYVASYQFTERTRIWDSGTYRRYMDRYDTLDGKLDSTLFHTPGKVHHYTSVWDGTTGQVPYTVLQNYYDVIPVTGAAGLAGKARNGFGGTRDFMETQIRWVSSDEFDEFGGGFGMLWEPTMVGSYPGYITSRYNQTQNYSETIPQPSNGHFWITWDFYGDDSGGPFPWDEAVDGVARMLQGEGWRHTWEWRHGVGESHDSDTTFYKDILTLQSYVDVVNAQRNAGSISLESAGNSSMPYDINLRAEINTGFDGGDIWFVAPLHSDTLRNTWARVVWSFSPYQQPKKQRTEFVSYGYFDSNGWAYPNLHLDAREAGAILVKTMNPSAGGPTGAMAPSAPGGWSGSDIGTLPRKTSLAEIYVLP